MIQRLLIRFAVVIFWVIAILGILYWPRHFTDKKNLNVFCWGDMLDPSVIARFEKETGIKVNLSYYASNEEMIVKLKATGGEGYDLIIPSDYSVQILRENDLLKPLNLQKLSFWDQMNPTLLNHPFDPENHYSIPFEWEIFVLGIDTSYFKDKPLDPSWKMLFQPPPYKITMTNDPIQALNFASFYLYGAIDSLSPSQLEDVIRLLSRQKQWVTAYADFRADYFLASKNCPVVASSSSYLWRTMHRFPYVSYVIPKEGTFVTIENICIPKASHQEELAYQFINYLYQPKQMLEHYHNLGLFPATLDAVALIDTDPERHKLLQADADLFKKFHFIQMIAPQREIRNAWVEIKSKGVYERTTPAEP